MLSRIVVDYYIENDTDRAQAGVIPDRRYGVMVYVDGDVHQRRACPDFGYAVIGLVSLLKEHGKDIDPKELQVETRGLSDLETETIREIIALHNRAPRFGGRTDDLPS